MRVLSVSEADYGNYGHNFSLALQSIGVDSVDFVRSPHPFKYGSESKLVSISEMVKGMIDADVVVVHHSHPHLFELAKNNCKGKVVVTHTGTRYREGHKELEILFGDTVGITDQCEFFPINPNLHYLVSPVEFELAGLIKDKPLKFAHYPSNSEVKGTAKILEMMAEFKDKCNFKVGTNTVDHYFQLERMAKCDVYIELFKPELNGRPYGCFGVTALEACAMGKIVITNNLHQNVYSKAYGQCPMTIANNEWQFKNIVNSLIEMKVEILRSIQKEAHEIMREYHSYQATGKRILKIINE